MRTDLEKNRFAGGLIAVLIAATTISCGAPGIPLPPSLHLPDPVTDLRAVRKGDRVYLAWTVPARTTDHQNVIRTGPTVVCRGTQTLTECGNPVGEIPGSSAPASASKSARKTKIQNSYVDVLPSVPLKTDLASTVVYAVEVQNDGGRSAGLSNQVKVSAVPVPPAPSGLQIQVTASGVQLTWAAATSQPPVDGFRRFYRIYRTEEGKSQSVIAGETPLSSPPQFLDRATEWEKQYRYRVTIVTAIQIANQPEVQVESDDSAEISVLTQDVFPPAVPEGLQAVFSGPGQALFIDLVWSPVVDADLAGYNIYRRNGSEPARKINVGLVKTSAFRDSTVHAGTEYFYSVSAVDLRGNESAHSEEATERVP